MNKRKNGNLKGSALLFTAAFIWGTAFVAQSKGMDYLGPFSFNAVRNLIAGTVLILIIFVMKLFNKNIKDFSCKQKYDKNDLIKGGILCGFILFFSSSFQQVGLKYTTVGKAGFITTLYIIIIPIMGIFIKKRLPAFKIWISLFLAIVGMYMLCMTESFRLSKGDFFMLICAFFNAAHIITIDHFSCRVEAVKMSCIQFFLCGLISLIPTFILETPTIANIYKSIWPLLYTAVLSSGVAFTLQIAGQKYTNPVLASLVMSLESVFSALAGWVVLKQAMSTRETMGCILVFAAVILAQIPILNLKKTIPKQKII
ncbi:MAG: DMT family transporter [Clostridia bacterium]|jgi:drug/metabolite transporter (DMT)-like permease|nr:DMT family transporter [Clostridia bacterium]MCI1999427.1 DMT family transporter [Clostridia bacterium]MCI2015071.1 DMT family transporter [Clostridia bacterium]